MLIAPLFLLLVGLGLIIATPRAHAIDLQPGEARPLPAGSRFAQTGVVVSKLDGTAIRAHQKAAGAAEKPTLRRSGVLVRRLAVLVAAIAPRPA